MKMIQPIPERTNGAMIGALLQGYSRPACSKAKTSKMEAAKETNAPRKSMRLHAFSETRVLGDAANGNARELGRNACRFHLEAEYVAHGLDNQVPRCGTLDDTIP
jgi:hypothetical protein